MATRGPVPDAERAPIVRRAPFAVNPRVGERGRQAQQRILDAALQAFGEFGYHQVGVSRITDAAGCNRATFYQYFSSKEDVFRHLAGELAQQLQASAEALDPIASSDDGRRELAGWIERHGELYLAYRPVFDAFAAAEEWDDAVASGSARVSARHNAIVRRRLPATGIPDHQLDLVIGLLLSCMTRARRLCATGATLVGGRPSNDRVNAALTGLAFRTLVDPTDVDARKVCPAPTRGPEPERGTTGHDRSRSPAQSAGLTAAGVRTLEALVAASHDVLVARGYHDTRVDDIAEAAGVSHGTFYRYFSNKQEVVRYLAERALHRLKVSFSELPDVVTLSRSAREEALTRWMQGYLATYAAEAAMIRIWIDAAAVDWAASHDTGAALAWGRRRLERFLAPRRFGDVELDALVLVALLDAVGTRRDARAAAAAAVTIIDRGLFGYHQS